MSTGYEGKQVGEVGHAVSLYHNIKLTVPTLLTLCTGSIELVVFSNLYETEINVVDIQRVTLEEFGKYCIIITVSSLFTGQ